MKRNADRPAKRARNGHGETNGDSEPKSSKDAYMLVYRRADAPSVRSNDPPPLVRSAIEAENTELRSLIDSRGAEWVLDGDSMPRIALTRVAVSSE